MTALLQLIIMLASAYMLSRPGNIHVVWFAFIITEVTAALIASFFLRIVYRGTISQIREVYA